MLLYINNISYKSLFLLNIIGTIAGIFSLVITLIQYQEPILFVSFVLKLSWHRIYQIELIFLSALIVIISITGLLAHYYKSVKLLYTYLIIIVIAVLLASQIVAYIGVERTKLRINKLFYRWEYLVKYGPDLICTIQDQLNCTGWNTPCKLYDANTTVCPQCNFSKIQHNQQLSTNMTSDAFNISSENKVCGMVISEFMENRLLLSFYILISIFVILILLISQSCKAYATIKQEQSSLNYKKYNYMRITNN